MTVDRPGQEVAGRPRRDIVVAAAVVLLAALVVISMVGPATARFFDATLEPAALRQRAVADPPGGRVVAAASHGSLPVMALPVTGTASVASRGSALAVADGGPFIRLAPDATAAPSELASVDLILAATPTTDESTVFASSLDAVIAGVDSGTADGGYMGITAGSDSEARPQRAAAPQRARSPRVEHGPSPKHRSSAAPAARSRRAPAGSGPASSGRTGSASGSASPNRGR